MTSTDRMTVEELLAVFISREMRDFETCACGALSFVPAAGMLLGRELHAPDIEIIMRGTTAYNPFVNQRTFLVGKRRGQQVKGR